MTSQSDDLDEQKNKLFEPFIEEKKVRNLDDFITLGWYCTIVLLSVGFTAFASLSNMVYMIYAGIPPKVNGCGSLLFNSTSEACQSLSVLREASDCVPNIEYQFKSVNVEFDLLCENSQLVKNCISIQMIGVLIGAPIAGHLSDRYGRRLVLIIFLVGISTFSAGTAFALTFLQFTVLRAFVGLFTGGLTAVQGVYLVENIPKQHRLWITMVTTSPHFIIFPAVAYFCHDWRKPSLFSGAVGVLAILTLCCLCESPRWLIQRGKIDKARLVLARMRRLNGKKCEEEAVEIEAMLINEQRIVSSKQKKQENYSFYHLAYTWKYLLWTVTVCSGVITASLVNYGLLFNMEKLSGSLYLNNTIFGVIRCAVNIFFGAGDYLFKWCGRKLINFTAQTFIIAALAIICGMYIQGLQKEYAWVIRHCTIGIIAMSSQLYIAKLMITNELFPTAIRNIAVSALFLSSRIGTIVAPQLFYLAHALPALPYLVLLVLSFTDLICFQFFLPETKGVSMSDHMPPKTKWILYRKRSRLEY